MSNVQTAAAPVLEAPSITPDFSKWSRANLERLATDLNNENLQLKTDLRVALDAYRANLALVQNTRAGT